MPHVLKTCSYANVSCVLTCSHSLHAYVLTCQRSCMLTCSRANVSCVPMCSRANMPCVLTCSRVNVPCVLTCLTCLCILVPCVLTCSRSNIPCALTDNLSYVLTYKKYPKAFFFEVKLIFRSVLYWDEKRLLIKVEARRVTKNASRHNESFKILIPQIHLGFVISLINNRRGSCQTHKKQFFEKVVNGLMPIFSKYSILDV